MSTIILGIESSCDDTSAAVIKDGVLLSSVIASQAVHEAYGGVVPELASRAHQQNIVPVVHEALKRAGVAKEDLSAIAFTRGPGLMGSLLVGSLSGVCRNSVSGSSEGATFMNACMSSSVMPMSMSSSQGMNPP